jgi:hypothetical protein
VFGCPNTGRFLRNLIDLGWNRKINPSRVFDRTLPLDPVAEGYRTAARSRSTSRIGGCPKSRLYSRLNCEGSS